MYKFTIYVMSHYTDKSFWTLDILSIKICLKFKTVIFDASKHDMIHFIQMDQF